MLPGPLDPRLLIVIVLKKLPGCPLGFVRPASPIMLGVLRKSTRAHCGPKGRWDG